LNAFDFIRFSSTPDNNEQGDILYDSLLILETDVPLACCIVNYGLGNHISQPIESKSQIYDFYTKILNEKTNFFSFESKKQFIAQKYRIDNPNQSLTDDEIFEQEDPHQKQTILNIFDELQIGPFESLRINPSKQFPNNFQTYNNNYNNNILSTMKEREELLRFREFRDIINREATKYIPSYNLCRVIYLAMNDNELFDDFTNHDETLQVNSICIFDILNILNSRDGHSHDRIIEVLHPGSGIRGRALNPTTPLEPIVEKQPHEGVITAVDKRLFAIAVSFEKAAIQEARSFSRIYTLEKTFNLADEERIQHEFERQEKEPPRVLNRRQFEIEDEHYQNVTITDATQWLMKRDQLGEFVIRPSRKGNEYLVLMIKFPNNTIASYNIVERGKRDPNDPRIGKELWIEDKQYDNVDDIRWSFVERIKEELMEITQYAPKGSTKWIDDMEAAQSILLQEKAKNPQQAVWRFTIDPQLAPNGVVILKWLRNTHEGFINEPIRLVADGYKYRDTIFPDLTKLVIFWKKTGFKTIPERGNKLVFKQKTETEELSLNQQKALEQQKINSFNSRRKFRY